MIETGTKAHARIGHNAFTHAGSCWPNPAFPSRQIPNFHLSLFKWKRPDEQKVGRRIYYKAKTLLPYATTLKGMEVSVLSGSQNLRLRLSAYS
jgi:hypothetical protein